MSAEATTAIVVSNVHSGPWGDRRLRPVATFYLIHYGAPVLATEAATLGDDWGNGSIILRPDPASAALDIAYLCGRVRGSSSWPADALDSWPPDPRDGDGFTVRSRLDPVVANAEGWDLVHLTIVVFERDPLVGDTAESVWRSLGIGVRRCDATSSRDVPP